MNDTLTLFDELLEHDPGSRIFLPLARLYRKQGLFQKAIDIVQKGIGHHPDYFEAHVFLIELFCDAGDRQRAESKAQSVFEKIISHDKFWACLRNAYLKSGQSDLALAVFLVEQHARQKAVNLFELLQPGIAQSASPQAVATEPVEPEMDLDAEEVAQLCVNSGIKTKTMAKLLVAQGEYDQAVELYDELIAGASSDQEGQELTVLRDAAQKAAQPQSETKSGANSKIFHVLNSLASRLEEKSASEAASVNVSSGS